MNLTLLSAALVPAIRMVSGGPRPTYVSGALWEMTDGCN